MKKLFSVFMALTVSVGLCLSSYAEQQKPYQQSTSLDNSPKYKEDSVSHVTPFTSTEVNAKFLPEMPQLTPVLSDDKFLLPSDAYPIIIDSIPYTTNALILDLERPTPITPQVHRLGNSALRKIPTFLDDS